MSQGLGEHCDDDIREAEVGLCSHGNQYGREVGRDRDTISDDAVVAPVLTRVELDRQGFLRNTVVEIARERARIARRGKPCVPEVEGVVGNTVLGTMSKVISSEPSSSLCSPQKILVVPHLS